MDIFNTKKIAKLEEELANMRSKYTSACRERDDANKKLLDLTAVRDTIPDDCVPGKYCGACEFSKEYSIGSMYSFGIETVYICNKGESCKNFVQKDV